MFIGENLTNLRIMHGYSRKELSDKLNVTEQAIWQYENNYTSPKMQIINDLKSLFNVKSIYFYKEDALSRYHTADSIPVMNIAYRSTEMNVISKTQSEAKHVEFIDSFLNYLTANLSLPTQPIIQLRNEVVNYLNNSTDERHEQILTVAELAREKLIFSQDTNDHLMFLVEKSGVFILEKPMGEEIDAYSLWTTQDRPYIILGNLKRSAVRRNFDIAHELAHLLLHYKVEFTNLNRKEHKALEKEANLFAGAFLLPEKAFLDDIKTISRITNPDAYLDLKKKWKTSLQVLGYRAANLGIIDSRKHRNFYAALHRKGYLKREPLDESLTIQKPQKIKSIFDFVTKKETIDIRKMIEKDWMADTLFFNQITGIEAEFFDNYFVQEQDFELISVKHGSNRVSN